MTAPKPIPHWRQIVAAFNEEEQYRFWERAMILSGGCDPDAQQAAWAIQDVREWQKERK